MYPLTLPLSPQVPRPSKLPSLRCFTIATVNKLKHHATPVLKGSPASLLVYKTKHLSSFYNSVCLSKWIIPKFWIYQCLCRWIHIHILNKHIYTTVALHIMKKHGQRMGTIKRRVGAKKMMCNEEGKVIKQKEEQRKKNRHTDARCTSSPLQLPNLCLC